MNAASRLISIDASATHGVRLPPFGREIKQRAQEGRLLNVYVFAGPHAWEQAIKRRSESGLGSATLLPPGQDPATYSWPIVRSGLLVVALGQTRTLAFELARVIVSYGTPLVFAMFGDNESLIVRGADWRGITEQAA